LPEKRSLVTLPVLLTQTASADSLRARSWLVAHGVAFAECDIERDAVAVRELAGARVTAAPLLVVDRAAVFGYRPAAFAALLGLPEAPRILRHAAESAAPSDGAQSRPNGAEAVGTVA
jgi:hypothetical protein